MIEITLKFDNISQAEAALRRLRDEPVSTVVATPAVTAPTPPPAPTTPTPPPATPSPIDAPTPNELSDVMQAAADRLKDKGAACMKIIASLGVPGVAEMTPAQRNQAKQQVEAL